MVWPTTGSNDEGEVFEFWIYILSVSMSLSESVRLLFIELNKRAFVE